MRDSSEGRNLGYPQVDAGLAWAVAIPTLPIPFSPVYNQFRTFLRLTSTGGVMSRLFIPVLMMLLPRFLPTIIRYFMLVWRLTFDKRVNIILRSLVPLGLVYFLWPFDLIKDNIPLIGRMDDVIILGMAVLILVKLAPPHVVDEHLGRAAPTDRPEDKDPSQVVDGKARFLDEEQDS